MKKAVVPSRNTTASTQPTYSGADTSMGEVVACWARTNRERNSVLITHCPHSQTALQKMGIQGYSCFGLSCPDYTHFLTVLNQWILMYQSSSETPLSQYCNHVSDFSVQCTVWTRKLETTVLLRMSTIHSLCGYMTKHILAGWIFM